MILLQKPKKSLGQNFLIDNNIINKIVKIGNINGNKTVMEIGAGYGHLTNEILSKKVKKVIAIEKDKKLALFLKNHLSRLAPQNFMNTLIFGNIWGEKMFVDFKPR